MERPLSDLAAAAASAPSATAPVEETREVFTPNAPSSPQWSLAERPQHVEVARVSPKEGVEPAENEPIAMMNAPAQDADTEPEFAAGAERESVSTEDREAAEQREEEESSLEPRKGWWQRRFKM
jgi:hypothetical protein